VVRLQAASGVCDFTNHAVRKTIRVRRMVGHSFPHQAEIALGSPFTLSLPLERFRA
jgi:hypothetical protein